MYLYNVIKTNDQMKNEILKSETLENLGYNVKVNYYSNNQVTALCIRENQKSLKPVFNYRFSNEKQMLEYIVKFFNNIQSRIDEKKKNQELKSEARKNFVNPYKVGQVLYSSWGYEQTNIDFYQVIEIKGKQVIIREISGSLTECNNYGSMAGKVKPNINDFKSEPMKKIVQIRAYSGKVNYSLLDKYGNYNLYEYTSGEEGVYCSWGY